LLQEEDPEEESQEESDEQEETSPEESNATLVILENTTESLRIIDYKHDQSGENGLAMLAEVDTGWQAWVNSDLGPVMDNYGTPAPAYGETLADSRYVGIYEDDSFVMSTTRHTDALDSVSNLYRSGFDDGVFVYHGERGHIERAYVGDTLIAEAESVDKTLHAFGPELAIIQVDANSREFVLGKSTTALNQFAYKQEGTVMGVTDLGKTHLDAGDLETSERNVVWDVQVTSKPAETEDGETTYELAWVAGVLNRTEAKVDIYLEKKTYAPKDGKLTSFQSLRSIPMPLPEDEEDEVEEEGEDGAEEDAMTVSDAHIE